MEGKEMLHGLATPGTRIFDLRQIDPSIFAIFYLTRLIGLVRNALRLMHRTLTQAGLG
jgi:hypothetical protein